MTHNKKQGPLGDVLPGREDSDPRTKGSRLQEKVEDRPAVGQVKPEDYPKGQRAGGETGRS